MISARIREAVAKRYWLRKPLVAFFTCAMPICCSIVSAEEPYQIDWIRQFGATSADFGSGIAGDGLGNVYLIGGNAGQSFIAQYSPDGSELWYNGIDDANLTHGIWTDNLGISYITGSTRVDLGGGPVEGNRDVVVLKYDPLGEAVWVRQFGTSSGDSARDISGDGLGNLYIIAGLGGDESIAKYGVDGTHQWTEQLPFDFPEGGESEGVAADGLGNVFITGYSMVEAETISGVRINTDVDIFVAKYDAEGTLAWHKEFETSNPRNYSYAAAADGLGSVYITGEGGIRADALLNKYDADGELLWTRLLGTEDKGERGYGVATDSWGNVYITGETTGSLGGPFAGGRSDIFVAKYDADGKHLWSQQFGTDGIDVGNAIWADSLGNVYVTGEMQRDAFVAKLIPADVAFLPGDINADGKVDLRDFNTLKPNFGAGDATRAMGDLDGDMLVDINDFNILKANFGNTATAAVPEPTSIGLAIFGMAAVTAISCAGLKGTGYRAGGKLPTLLCQLYRSTEAAKKPILREASITARSERWQ